MDDLRATPVVTAMSALSGCGRGVDALYQASIRGEPAFAPVERFDVGRRRVRVAATVAGSPQLVNELRRAVRAVVDDETGQTPALSGAECSRTPLYLAAHAHPELTAAPPDGDGTDRAPDLPTVEDLAATVATDCGLAPDVRAYTSACVASSTALADAAAMVAGGRADRVVVAAGYLLEPDQFALFDAGRALAVDGRVRPFSAQRKGIVLGDGVAAVLIESRAAARARGAPVLAELAGWARTGDAHHVVAPHPEGIGLARAVSAAISRARIAPHQVDYVNAHGSGTAFSDAAEAAALRRALGDHAEVVAVSSTKSVHGQALEASGLLEFIITVRSLGQSSLPVNSGFIDTDPDCRLNLVLAPVPPQRTEHALSLNCAFGGANTALLLRAPC